MEEILIFMDDSGKLNKNETSTIYAGLYFLNKIEYLKFINHYKKVIKDIKPKAYKNYKKITKSKARSYKEFEIKGTTLKFIEEKDKRRIFQLIKKQKLFAVFINNKKIYQDILKDKASRGRYCDYAKKRIVKEIIKSNISNSLIDPEKPFLINLKMDQETKLSNGYYDLQSSIYEELKHGILNYNYGGLYTPIFKDILKVKAKQYVSLHNYGIQASDFVAYSFKKMYDNNELYKNIKHLKVILFLP